MTEKTKSRVKITQLTIGRTISMEKFANEKQEVTVNIIQDENDTDKEKLAAIGEAYELADKAFVKMFPKYGTVNPEYTGYIKSKAEKYKAEALAENQEKMPMSLRGLSAEVKVGDDIPKIDPQQINQPVANPSLEKLEIKTKSN